MTGFVTMPRGWMEHAVFGNPKRDPLSRHAAFMWLVEQAQWQDGTVSFHGADVELKRGQLVVSLRHLGGRWGWDTMKVARFISAIQAARLVARHALRHEATIITICGYGENGLGVCITETLGEQRPRRSVSSDRDGEKEGNKDSTLSGAKAPSRERARKVSPIEGDVRAAEMIAIWNEVCGHIKPSGDDLVPNLRVERTKMLLARLKDTFQGDIAGWRRYCERVAASPYLRGDTKDWRASIGWVLGPKNIIKVCGGEYDPPPDAKSGPKSGVDDGYGYDRATMGHLYGRNRKAAE